MPSICPICGQSHRTQEEAEAEDREAREENEDRSYVPYGGAD